MLLSLALGLLLLTGCGGGGSAVEPIIPGWPPDLPRQPQRLVLSHPDEANPQLWWSENILSLVPPDIYGDSYFRRRAAEVVQATNERRAAYGLPAVQELPLLDRVAQAHAMDQAIRDYWAHKTPEGLGSHDRIRAAGGGEVSVGGENSTISFHNYGNGDEIVRSFENHPGHRELLLNPDVRYIGVGVYDYGPGENEFIMQLLVDFAAQ